RAPYDASSPASPSASSRRRATFASRAYSSSAVETAVLRAASRFASRQAERREQRDEDQVAQQDEPRQVQVEDVLPVPLRKEDLRRDQRGAEEQRGREPAAPAHERHE